MRAEPLFRSDVPNLRSISSAWNMPAIIISSEMEAAAPSYSYRDRRHKPTAGRAKEKEEKEKKKTKDDTLSTCQPQEPQPSNSRSEHHWSSRTKSWHSRRSGVQGGQKEVLLTRRKRTRESYGRTAEARAEHRARMDWSRGTGEVSPEAHGNRKLATPTLEDMCATSQSPRDGPLVHTIKRKKKKKKKGKKEKK